MLMEGSQSASGPSPCQPLSQPLSPADAEALRNSDAIFRAVFDNAAIGVAIRDVDGRYVLTNPAFQRMHGYTAEEFQQMGFPDVTHPDDVARDQELYLQLLAGQRENYHIQKRNLRKDGRIVYVDLSVSLAQDAATGRVLGVSIAQDVTDRVEAENAERAAYRQTAEILESISDAFYAVDHEWQFLYVNGKAEQSWGMRREDLIGRSIWDAFPQALGSVSHEAHLRAAQERTTVTFEAVSPVLNKPVWVCIYPSSTGLCVYFRDVTEQRQAERERDYVLASAQCLLWYADIYETDGQYLHWDKHIPDPVAARRFLPVAVLPGEHFEAASYRSRLPEDRDRCDVLGTASIRAGRSYEQEFRVTCVDGSVRWIREDVRVETVETGKQWRAVGVCTDITDRKQREAHIEELNARLRDAMTETHHRVKNNLQVIAALVDMLVMDRGEAVPVHEVRRIGRHARSLASIHDILTAEAKTSGATEDLSAAQLLEKLLVQLQPMVDGRRIRHEADDIRLRMRQGTALAVLVNELVSNAVKHGSGDIDVRLAAHDRTIELTVEDEGGGFPAGFRPSVDAHTGVELIENLSRWDLQGTTTYENRPEGGARVRIRFSVA
jgi:PAS domain S-box-containing protein